MHFSLLKDYMRMSRRTFVNSFFLGGLSGLSLGTVCLNQFAFVYFECGIYAGKFKFNPKEDISIESQFC